MKILINGCGYIGRVHLNSIRKYQLCDVAVCDVNPRSVEEAAREFDVQETYTSLEDALKNPFDGVVICTPNSFHEDHIRKCMEAGLHVMVEKPVSHTLESAEEIVRLARQYNKFVFVAYCLRFAPAYQMIRSYIREGRLGKVFGVRASVAGRKAITDAKTDYRTKKSMGGGVVSDFSHEIDYALWFVDKKALNVSCRTKRVVHKDWDVPDMAELLIECEDDAVISIHMDFLQMYFGRSIEVYGTGGSIRWRDNEPVKICLSEDGKWEEREAAIDWDLVYRDEMMHYLECLRDGRRPLVDEEHGLEIMKIVEKCSE